MGGWVGRCVAVCFPAPLLPLREQIGSLRGNSSLQTEYLQLQNQLTYKLTSTGSKLTSVGLHFST